MTDAYPIRVIGADDFPAFHAVGEHAFNSTRPTAESIRHELITFEADRSLVAFDGPQMVGTTCSFSFDLTVPGATVPAAGVSGVSVLPSHRRRGILSGLMRRQLDDTRSRGEPLAVLFASESGIYRRFGYGPGSQSAMFTISRGEGVLTRDAPADPGLRLRITEPPAARDALAALYRTVLAIRPGLFARDDRWWDSILDDPEFARHGATQQRCLLAEDASGPRGYALYRARPGWNDDGLPDAAILVGELVASDPAATAALWADLLGRDLASQLTAYLQPADDPLLHLLADPRRARSRVSDGLWVRLVEAGPALSRRRYAAPVEVVIDVADGFCPWNTGRWRLTVPPAVNGYQPAGLAGTCERTSDPADLALPAHVLGAAYLGGTRLAPLAAAGLVTESRPGALAALSAAMSWDPGPWCPLIF
jgi:predicted acetyltransferase